MAEQASAGAVKAEGSSENQPSVKAEPAAAASEADKAPCPADPSRIIYGNEAFFVFFRLHHYLYDRCATSSPLARVFMSMCCVMEMDLLLGFLAPSMSFLCIPCWSLLLLL